MLIDAGIRGYAALRAGGSVAEIIHRGSRLAGTESGCTRVRWRLVRSREHLEKVQTQRSNLSRRQGGTTDIGEISGILLLKKGWYRFSDRQAHSLQKFLEVHEEKRLILSYRTAQARTVLILPKRRIGKTGRKVIGTGV